jgi:DNA-binding MurR/RpiR family transcriptional regulator
MARFAGAQEFRDHVLTIASSLPPQQRAIADYLIHHLREVPFQSLPELAELTKVSEPTIVRFAQSIGFSGFRDLKMELLQLPPRQQHTPHTEPTPSDDPRHVLHSVAHLETDNIAQTTRIVDLSTFKAVAEALHQSEHTYVFGMGVSASLARMARYILTEVGVRCTVLSSDFTSPEEQLFVLRPSDLLLAISLPPYSRQTLEMLRGADERGTSTAVITNGLNSPACSVAKWVLSARTHNMMFTNAVASIVVLINALATQYAMRHRTRSMEAFAYTTRVMSSSPDVITLEEGETD